MSSQDRNLENNLDYAEYERIGGHEGLIEYDEWEAEQAYWNRVDRAYYDSIRNPDYDLQEELYQRHLEDEEWRHHHNNETPPWYYD